MIPRGTIVPFGKTLSRNLPRAARTALGPSSLRLDSQPCSDALRADGSNFSYQLLSSLYLCAPIAKSVGGEQKGKPIAIPDMRRIGRVAVSNLVGSCAN